MLGSSEFQIPITGIFTAVSQTVSISSSNQTTQIVQFSGTWVGTLIIEGSNNATTYFPILVLQNSTNLLISNITSNDVYISNSNGFSDVRIRSSAWTSGTANLTVYGSDAATLLNTVGLIRGGTDGSIVGNNGDKLKVDANLTSGQLVPTITNKLRFRLNVGNTTVGAAYTSLFSRIGTGLLFGFQAAFNNSNIRIKLTIDSGVVFEDTLGNFQAFQINDTTTGRVQMGGFLSTIGNTFDFSSRFAIPYSSNVDISVQRSDASNHNNNNWLVILTEDT